MGAEESREQDQEYDPAQPWGGQQQLYSAPDPRAPYARPGFAKLEPGYYGEPVFVPAPGARPPITVGPPVRMGVEEDTPMVPRIAVVNDDLTPEDSASEARVSPMHFQGDDGRWGAELRREVAALRAEAEARRRDAEAARGAARQAEAKVGVLETELLRARDELRKANDRNSELLRAFGQQVASLESEMQQTREKGGPRAEELHAVQQELIATKRECQRREAELERLKELAAEELAHLHGNRIGGSPMATTT